MFFFSLLLFCLVIIKTFIDRIIKRLQHFKRSLDAGLSTCYSIYSLNFQQNDDFNYANFSFYLLVHVRKRNTLVNGPIVNVEYRPQSETSRRKNESDQSSDCIPKQQHPLRSPSFDTNEETKHVRPYFLIRPQTVLVLPNEIGI